MRKEIIEELENGIIPFWKSLRDEEYGGYYGYMDYDLNLNKQAEKGCILNSRILWFFSRAYLERKEESLLHEAKHAYAFLKEKCLDTEFGGVFWSMTFDGQPLDTTKHTYNQAFAIYALACYYQASKEKEALLLAMDLFHLIESQCRDLVGYLESFDRNFQPESNEKLSENGVIATRTMNTALHVLEAYTLLYQVTEDATVKEKLIELLLTIRYKIYCPKKKRQEVFFDDDYHSLLDLHSYGHDIEASWLMDLALQALGEAAFSKAAWQDLCDMTLSLAEQTYAVAFDGNSFANECEAGIVDENRIWWVHAEAMVGFVNAYQKTGDDKYMEAAEKLWLFTKNYLIDGRAGSEWFWEVNPDGSPIHRAIVEPWKCPYHNGRMCFELMRRLQQEKNYDS